jgi:hypothetical protein
MWSKLRPVYGLGWGMGFLAGGAGFGGTGSGRETFLGGTGSGRETLGGTGSGRETFLGGAGFGSTGSGRETFLGGGGRGGRGSCLEVFSDLTDWAFLKSFGGGRGAYCATATFDFFLDFDWQPPMIVVVQVRYCLLAALPDGAV